MNADFNKLSPEERDARITALLLGELAPHEANDLRDAIAADAELTRAFERRKQTIELLRATIAADEAEIPAAAPVRLADERRETLLKTFKTSAQPKPRAMREFFHRAKTVAPLAAAAIAILSLIAATMLPSLAKAKARARRVTPLPAASASADGALYEERRRLALSQARPVDLAGRSDWMEKRSKALAQSSERESAIVLNDSMYVIADSDAEVNGRAMRRSSGNEIVLPKAGEAPPNLYFQKSAPSGSETVANAITAPAKSASGGAAAYVNNFATSDYNSPAPATPHPSVPPTAAQPAPKLALPQNSRLGNQFADHGDFYAGVATAQQSGLAAGSRSVEQLAAKEIDSRRLLTETETQLGEQTRIDNSGLMIVTGPNAAILPKNKPSLTEDLTTGIVNGMAAPRQGVVSDPNVLAQQIEPQDGTARTYAFRYSTGKDGSAQPSGGDIGGVVSTNAVVAGDATAYFDSQTPQGSFYRLSSEDPQARGFNRNPGDELKRGDGAIPSSGKQVAQTDSPAQPIDHLSFGSTGGRGEGRARARNPQPQVALPSIASATDSDGDSYGVRVSRNVAGGYGIDGLNQPLSDLERPVGQKEAKLDGKKVEEAEVLSKSVAAARPKGDAQREAEARGEDRRMLGLSVAPPSEPEAPKRPATPPPVPQPELLTRDNAFSTFSLNVAEVSFKLAAARLEKGAMPDAASIRSEEFLNAFDYRDPQPAPGVPVAFAWERAQYPFAQNRDALRFSVKTAAAGRDGGRPLNIVLALDSSGSMERADRVQIVREALRTLAAQLQPQDKLSIVTFSRTARLWVDGVSGTNASAAVRRTSQITPEGGTNLEDAMDLAYRTALRHYAANAINRVVLLTDGAANLGDVQPANLKAKVEAHRKQGVALDCFGIGWDGYDDDLLEQLSRNGDGRYGFINSPDEAGTEFAGQLAGALRVAASDVKVQVEFNPKRVNAYRQIGYAKHQLTKEQFRDNTVDAAEIGASEAGNALYIIDANPRGEGPLATVRARFRIPGTSDYREHEWAVPFTPTATPIEQSSPAMKLAVSSAAFSETLAGNPFAAEVTSDRLLKILSGAPETFGADRRPKKLEWMIRQTKSISGR